MKKDRNKPSVLLVINKNEKVERGENINVVEFDNRILKKIDKKYETSYDYIIFENGIYSEIKFDNYILAYDNQQQRVFMNLLIFNTILMNNIKNVIENGQIEVASLVRWIQIYDIRQEDFIFKELIKRIKIENKLKKEEIKKYERVIAKCIKEHYSQGSMIRRIKFYLKKRKITISFIYRILKNVEEDIESKIQEVNFELK